MLCWLLLLLLPECGRLLLLYCRCVSIPGGGGLTYHGGPHVCLRRALAEHIGLITTTEDGRARRLASKQRHGCGGTVCTVPCLYGQTLQYISYENVSWKLGRKWTAIPSRSLPGLCSQEFVYWRAESMRGSGLLVASPGRRAQQEKPWSKLP